MKPYVMSLIVWFKMTHCTTQVTIGKWNLEIVTLWNLRMSTVLPNMAKYSFVSISNQVFAFVVKLQTQPVSCQAHFGISHNSLDVLHVSKIVPIDSTGGRMVCIPASNLISKRVFISIDDDLCVSMWFLFRTGYTMTKPLLAYYFLILICILTLLWTMSS